MAVTPGPVVEHYDVSKDISQSKITDLGCVTLCVQSVTRLFFDVT
ncbi:hypothetical protein [Escherichia coli]|nr:hypothetical protein [Escherichia coli]EHN94232.1 hypothetical protein ESOG_04692 [Escherichia coli E101]